MLPDATIKVNRFEDFGESTHSSFACYLNYLYATELNYEPDLGWAKLIAEVVLK